MQNKRIVWRQPANGVLAVTTASSEWGGTLAQLAEQVVPMGIPYKIVDISDFPYEFSEFREAWDMDLTEDNCDGLGKGVY